MAENTPKMTDDENTVFVTVGTTYFDELICETNKLEFHRSLRKLGYNKLIVQFGIGSVTPSIPLVDNLTNPSLFSPLPLYSFRYKNNLDEEFDKAKLVISHGGAGTCMKALSPAGKRRLVIVINTSLMGNHQEELACTLADGKYALVTTPESLIGLLSKKQITKYNGEDVDVSRLLDPSISPLKAGFCAFKRGDPKYLSVYLNRRLGLDG